MWYIALSNSIIRVRTKNKDFCCEDTVFPGIELSFAVVQSSVCHGDVWQD